VSDTLPELITALQWKVSQKDGEVPLLLVGLLDGQLVLAEVLRASVNLSPELQLTRLEHWMKGETWGEVKEGGSMSQYVCSCVLVCV